MSLTPKPPIHRRFPAHTKHCLSAPRFEIEQELQTCFPQAEHPNSAEELQRSKSRSIELSSFVERSTSQSSHLVWSLILTGGDEGVEAPLEFCEGRAQNACSDDW